MKVKIFFLIIIGLFFLTGCTKVIKDNVRYVFPDFPNIYAIENLSKENLKMVLVMPVTVEGFPDKTQTRYFSEILMNSLTKLGVGNVFVEDFKNLEAIKKKFNTTTVCEMRFLYSFIPSKQRMNVKSNTSAFINGRYGEGNSNTNGMYSANGSYFQFNGATCKIKNIDSEQVLFSDEISSTGSESSAVKKIVGDLSICLSGDDVKTFKRIFIRNVENGRIEDVERTQLSND